MAVHLQIRDLPDEIHGTLRRRAEGRGVSLRQYALEILREHCLMPTTDDWLDGLERLTSVPLDRSTAAVIGEAREEDEAALARALGRS